MTTLSHKFRSRIITALAIAVIIFAVVFSSFRLLVPYITDYGDSIEVELSRQLGMSVEIGMVDADIAWMVPRLKLLDVSLYETDENRLFIHLEEINLSLDWLASLRNLKPELGAISLVGLDLNIERDANGDVIFQGFRFKKNAQDTTGFVIPAELNALFENSSMYLVSSTLRWTDQLNNHQKLFFDDVNLALINNNPDHQLSINMSLPAAYGESIELVIDVKGPLADPVSWNGQIFVELKNLQLKKWFDDYWKHVEFTGSGQLNANVWIDWRNHQLMEVNAELDANNLALHYMDDDIRSWFLDVIKGKVKWQQHKQNWALNIRDLEVTRNNQSWPVVSAMSVKIDKQKNSADIDSTFFRIEDLSYLAGLFAHFVPLGDFDWNTMVAPYQSYGDVYDLKIHLPMDYLTQSRINAKFVDLSYHSSGSVPSVKGLDGRLVYDEKGVMLKLDSHNVVLDFDGLFRNEIFLTALKGDVGIYNDQSGWLLQSDYLLMDTPHLQTATMFKVEVPVDAPAYMDLTSRFENALGSYKSLYLPAKIMSPGVVRWLDDALVDLEIPNGGVVYHGSFADFPFLKNEGVFEVLFNVNNATIKYMPAWPALRNMQAEIQFYNQSMNIRHAKGTVFDARFDNTLIEIKDFSDTHVSVKGDLHGPLSDVLKFVAQSPLHKVVGSYVTGFAVDGETDLDLDLQIPVSKDEPVKVTGLLAFINNSVSLPQENYHFKDFSGDLKFTETGVWAPDLSANLDTYPLKMNISMLQKNKKSITHIAADGYFPVKSILAPVVDVKPYFHGKTNWKVDVYVPDSSADEVSRVDVFVNSNLKGVGSTLPGPFRKSASEQAPFKFHLGIVQNELQAYIKYAENLKLSANLAKGQWTANVDAPGLKGRAKFMNDFSLNNAVNIDLEYINVGDFETHDALASNVQAVDFPPLMFNARKMEWQGKTIADVNIKTRRMKTGMKIDHLELHVPGISIVGQGSWSNNWIRKNITELDLTLQANDLGQGLKNLGITESIKNGEGSSTFKWKWNAEPYKFSWKILQGEGVLRLGNGSFTDVDAGAGRLLGVLNIETIFSLDFRNQVAAGFSYDKMKANLNFSDGHVFTKNFEIESKVADIQMQGRIGMAAKDYDLEVKVFPKVSNAFTAIGVATGGAVLGLGVHLFQKLFGVDEAAGSVSTVTGSWEHPVITEVIKPKADKKSSKDKTD